MCSIRAASQKIGKDGRKEKMCVKALASMQFPNAAHLIKSEANLGRARMLGVSVSWVGVDSRLQLCLHSVCKIL